MNRMIFVNLPVTDIDTATAFYTGLGFSVNAQYSDEQTTCIVISDTIVVMLLAETRFRDFINGDISNAHNATEVLLCLSADSRAEVDELVAKALAGGGKPWKDLMQDGPMYGHSFADPDGHVWEVLHMEQPGA